MLWLLGGLVVGGGALVLFWWLWCLFMVSDPCPRCGSRWKIGSPYLPDGRLADVQCYRCGNVWTPDWVRRCREQGK